MLNQVIYCGHKVNVYPANKGNIRIESPIFKQTITPGILISNGMIVDETTNKKYSIVVSNDGEVHKGYKL